MNRKHGGVRNEHPAGLVDFSSNLNPWGPPKTVKQLFSGDLLREIVPYPDPGYASLKESIAVHTGRHPEEVFPANGSEEAFFWACRLLGPERVLVVHPTFSEYEVAAGAAGAEVLHHVLRKEEGFRLCPKEARAAAAEADLVFVCNPDNPTGALFPREELEALADGMKTGAILLVDEAFMDFVAAREAFTCAPLLSEKVWVSGSLTKFYSLAGLRSGYLLAPAGVVAGLEGIAPLWRVNRLAELATLAALEDGGYREEMPGRMERERDRFSGLLSAAGLLEVYPASANFILCELTGTGLNAPKLKARLLEGGFLIRDASDFPGLDDSFIRLAVLGPEGNDALVKELERTCTRG